MLVAWLLSEKPDVIFFVRLGVMIPLGFLMYFTASQYKKEREAEEEYAFKSAISFSLEPYRDLLIRMRKDEELEAEFVKRLMEDVFDNPVKRLYNHKDANSELEELIDAAKTVTGKLPKEQKKAFFGFVKKCISEYLGE